MTEVTKVHNLSFYNDRGILTLSAKQYDTGRKFIFHIINGDEPFDLTGCHAYLRILKADGTQFQGEECCFVSTNQITVDTSVGNGNQILTCAGLNNCELHITDDANKSLTTWDFTIDVAPRVHDGNQIESVDSFDTVDQITKATILLDSKLTTHQNDTANPHNVTTKQLGIAKVENKSSEDIRAEITKENITNGLGYTPYTPTEIDAKFSNIEKSNVAERLVLRRLTGADSITSQVYRASIDEIPPGHASAPTDAMYQWWHNLTMNSADANYATQFSLCMTAPGAYFRQKDSGVWRDWFRIATNKDLEGTIVWENASPYTSFSSTSFTIDGVYRYIEIIYTPYYPTTLKSTGKLKIESTRVMTLLEASNRVSLNNAGTSFAYKHYTRHVSFWSTDAVTHIEIDTGKGQSESTSTIPTEDNTYAKPVKIILYK